MWWRGSTWLSVVFDRGSGHFGHSPWACIVDDIAVMNRKRLLLDASEAAAQMKRHCVAVIDRVTSSNNNKRLASPLTQEEQEEMHALHQQPKRHRHVGTAVEPEPEAPTDDRLEACWRGGLAQGWKDGHAQGYKDGHDRATESFSTEIVEEMDRLTRTAVQEINLRYDQMYLELCRDFVDRNSHPPRFIF